MLCCVTAENLWSIVLRSLWRWSELTRLHYFTPRVADGGQGKETGQHCFGDKRVYPWWSFVIYEPDRFHGESETPASFFPVTKRLIQVLQFLSLFEPCIFPLPPSFSWPADEKLFILSLKGKRYSWAGGTSVSCSWAPLSDTSWPRSLRLWSDRPHPPAVHPPAGQPRAPPSDSPARAASVAIPTASQVSSFVSPPPAQAPCRWRQVSGHHCPSKPGKAAVRHIDFTFPLACLHWHFCRHAKIHI